MPGHAGYYRPLGWREHYREARYLLRANWQARRCASFVGMFREIDEYGDITRKVCDLELENARVFEIGYGRRPDRLIALMSLGADASGIDLLQPLLSLGLSAVVESACVNGIGSTVRSTVRRVLFDGARRRKFVKQLSDRGVQLKCKPDAFLVGDVTALTMPSHQFDVILCEDVFEHIPEEDLRVILSKMAGWLRPTGVCLIRPDIFTGPWGGHLRPRGRGKKGKAVSIQPWEHLKDDCFEAAVYLNRVTRQQYRKLFEEYFDIIEERGDELVNKELLTSDVQNELRSYPQEELLSGRVLFVLTPKRRAVATA